MHERLHAAKLEELTRVRAEIECARAALVDTRNKGAEIARMPALLAWEARVERVSVWPFDAPTLVRFALFLLIPLGSWLGGALVERRSTAYFARKRTRNGQSRPGPMRPRRVEPALDRCCEARGR